MIQTRQRLQFVGAAVGAAGSLDRAMRYFVDLASLASSDEEMLRHLEDTFEVSRERRESLSDMKHGRSIEEVDISAPA